MAPGSKFKGPVAYDPTLAKQTLANPEVSHQELEPTDPKLRMARELGLEMDDAQLRSDEEDEESSEEEEAPEAPPAPASVNGEGELKSPTGNAMSPNGDENGHSRHHGFVADSALQALTKQLNTKNEALNQKNDRLTSTLASEKERTRKALAELRALDKYLAEVRGRTRASIAAFKEQQSVGQQHNAKLTAIVTQLQEEGRTLRKEVSTLRSQLAKAQEEQKSGDGGAEAAKLRKQCASHEATLKLREAHIQTIEAKLAAAESGAESVEALAEAERERDELRRKVDAQAAELADARAGAGASEGPERGAGAAEAAELRKQVSELQSKLEAESAARVAAEASARDAGAAVAAAKDTGAKKGEMVSTPALRQGLRDARAELARLKELREELVEDISEVADSFFSDDLIDGVTTHMEDMERSLRAQLDGCVSRDVFREKIESARRERDDARAEIKNLSEEIDIMKDKYEHELKVSRIESQGRVAHWKSKFEAESARRKNLHNQVLELKGNIRVFCRVRKPLKHESEDVCVKVKDEEAMILDVAERQKQYDFDFDRVFSSDVDQPEVFTEVEPLATSVIDGFNVCIMAYGQTGSGKTYTMEGPKENPGVNMRALSELFAEATRRNETLEVDISCSVLEIYNETILDLLASKLERDSKLDVKVDRSGSMYVPDLSIVPVENMDDVHALANRAHGNRSTFATNMNEHSSRSHLVLSVYVHTTSKQTGKETRSKLHLIDLAGSERISRSGAQGDRLKEAQCINSSLSALGDVIASLQTKKGHVPFRNSKLTRLLQDSLEGQSKCLMFVTISPVSENAGESKCSLDFASRARKVELGKAQKQIVGGGGAPEASPRR